MTTLREFLASPLNTHLRTSTLQCHKKILNVSQALLFDLLTTDILTDIEICVSGLDHCDRFKPVVSRFKLCVTPSSLQCLMIYGSPITILEYSVDIMESTMNG